MQHDVTFFGDAMGWQRFVEPPILSFGPTCMSIHASMIHNELIKKIGKTRIGPPTSDGKGVRAS